MTDAGSSRRREKALVARIMALQAAVTPWILRRSRLTPVADEVIRAVQAAHSACGTGDLGLAESHVVDAERLVAQATDRAATADRIRARQRIGWLWLPAILIDPRRRCPHDCQRAIYGDEILTARARARCLDCGRPLQSLPRKGQVCRHGRTLR